MRYLLFFWLAVLLGLPTNAQVRQQRVYGSAGNEEGGLLTPLSTGGYLLVGSQRVTSSVSPRLFVARLNAVGDTIFTKRVTLPGYTFAIPQYTCVNAANQVLVTATTLQSSAPLNGHALLLLFSAQGDTLWTRKTIGPTNDYYSSVLLGNDGNFVLTASLNTFPQWMKISATGQVVSQTTINYDATDVGAVSGLFKDNSGQGGYWLLNTKGIVGNARKFLHLTESGVVDQSKPLYGNGYDLINSIAPLANNAGYIACQDGRLVRFTAALDTIWTKTLRYTAPNGFSGFAGPNLIQPLADGNFVLAGGFNSFGNRVYLSKITPTGQVLRDTVLFRTGGSEYVRSLLVAPGTSNYVFSGYATQGPLGGADLFLGIHANWNVLGTTSPRQQPVRTLQAWPNPVAGSGTLQLRADQALIGEVLLRDALGCVVRRWPTTRELATAGGQHLQLAGVPAGVYLLTGQTTDGQRYVARLLCEQH
ncbi:hypothetical protein [Hymenobacter psychrotolerans]|uniref:Por secretion system C-terminal sorting domain-containing protein n=1 Tax=Hymenobacter psychrotolerans DSM 18569 TaxID=1121959 RepID=A0A1M6PFA7_9BACT|nr:hypothetical protein [Hymenobacter psychrotolerans]SHK06623.1 hypothetical protein SAMN02746009_00221 [Hymenobacter psychrotolerans DSM 18569]